MGSSFYINLGSIVGVLLPIIFIVGLVICCVAVCHCCSKCNRRPQTVRNATTTIVYTHVPPQQPLSPSGYQPSHPGYQPANVDLPSPTAPPPSYWEATDPTRPSVAFSPGQWMLPHPSQPASQPSHSDELAQLPYNPACCPEP